MNETNLIILLLGAFFPSALLVFVYQDKKKMALAYHIKIAQALGHAASLRDHGTGAHNLRVAYMATIIGEALHLKKKALQALMKGAFLHDIGKIGIADAILLKEGPLNEEEWAKMKLHPILGQELVEDMPWFDDALDVIVHHHEKFDGTGYPDKLKGYKIPLNARIFAMIDVFDALLASRPYKKALPYEKAIAIMKENKGTHFDPKLFELFLTFAPDFAEMIATHTTAQLGEKLKERRKKIFGL